MGPSDKLMNDLASMATLTSTMGSNVADSVDKLTYEKLIQAMAAMDTSSARDPYTAAENTMNKELKKKGLPELEVILESFYEVNPEYSL